MTQLARQQTQFHTSRPQSRDSDTQAIYGPQLSSIPALIQRMQADPRTLSPADVLALQRTIGNRATSHWLASPPSVQRKRHTESDESSRYGPAGGEVTPDVAQSIRHARANGSSLNRDIRSDMEDRFGADFRKVRIHTDQPADTLNRTMDARAFTAGPDIFFSKGAYQPGTKQGKQLLAHELTHVVQQGAIQRGALRKESKAAVANRTDRSIVQRHPDDANVTDIAWEQADNMIPSSGGGKGGVMFVKFPGIQHVLKPVIGSPSSAIFGEELLARYGNAETTESRVIATDSTEGQRILRRIQHHNNQVGNDEADLKERWASKIHFYQHADYFLLQRSMKPENEFGKVLRDDPTRILGNTALLQNIGRMLAIDTFMGNADRFQEMNVENMFLTDGDKLAAIDTEAIYQNMQASIDAEIMLARIRDQRSWLKMITEGDEGTEVFTDEEVQAHRSEYGQLPTAAPSSKSKSMLTQFDKWFDIFFKATFLGDVGKLKHYSPAPEVVEQLETETDWQAVRNSIYEGFLEAIHNFNDMLVRPGGFEDLTDQFSALTERYGGDINFDLEAMKVRSAYIQSILSGKTADEAWEEIQLLAGSTEDWVARVAALASIAEIENLIAKIPNRPAKLKKRAKMKRALRKRSGDERQAEEIKQQIRGLEIEGQPWESIIEQVEEKRGEISGGRRLEKAHFEAVYKGTVHSMLYKADELKTMGEEVDKLLSLATRGGAQANLAIARLGPVQSLVESRELDKSMYGAFNKATNKFSQQFSNKDKRDQNMLKTLTTSLDEVRRNKDDLKNKMKSPVAASLRGLSQLSQSGNERSNENVPDSGLFLNLDELDELDSQSSGGYILNLDDLMENESQDDLLLNLDELDIGM